MERIVSRKNPLCAHVRRLAASASYRAECGEYLCESPKLLGEALANGAVVHTVIASDDATLPPLSDRVREVRVPEDVMRSIAPSETPQGVLFLCSLAENALPETLAGRRYAVLDTVQDPGNVGTILRTADAFGADGVFLTGACADLYNPKTIRATMGAIFRLPVYRASYSEVKRLLSESGIPLYGAALREDTEDARRIDYSRCAIAIGSEGRGLTQELLLLCDRTVKIPMRVRCESLNAAIAAAVLLWEAARGERE